MCRCFIFHGLVLGFCATYYLPECTLLCQNLRSFSELKATAIIYPSMLSTTIVALLCASVVVGEEKRQVTDKAQFTSAAEQLISQYIPSTALEVLEASVSSAASVGHIAGSPMSLIYDALLAISVPAWFPSAVPSEYSTQLAALEGKISSLRAGTSSVTGPAIVVVTSTGDHGTITTTFTSDVTATRYILLHCSNLCLLFLTDLSQYRYDDLDDWKWLGRSWQHGLISHNQGRFGRNVSLRDSRWRSQRCGERSK